jgi:cystathionine gamma-synthase/methionine-gamma-lyase
LNSHPQHELAKKIFPQGMYGGMISFEIRNAQRADIYVFMEKLKLILPATTLGDVYSLVLYPPMSSHRALSTEERARVGISERLIRLSVGIEDVDEIIEDLEEALK